MNTCQCCNKETINYKYCSKSCAAKINNKVPKRKAKIWRCKICNIQIQSRRTYCDSCNPNIIDWSAVTYGETKTKRKYQVNSRIRELGRNAYKKSNRPQKCAICNYDKHYEVHHIKSISSFPDSSFISEINDLDNLVALCPTHHWEVDKGLVSI